jgi:hypothetical protein
MSAADYIEYQRRPTELALIIYEFLRTRFVYPGLTDETCDMRILRRLIPLVPTHPFCTTQDATQRRALLNGSIVKFAGLFTDFERNPFALACEPGPLDELVADFFDDSFINQIREHEELVRKFEAGAMKLVPREDRDGEERMPTK